MRSRCTPLTPGPYVARVLTRRPRRLALGVCGPGSARIAGPRTGLPARARRARAAGQGRGSPAPLGTRTGTSGCEAAGASGRGSRDAPARAGEAGSAAPRAGYAEAARERRYRIRAPSLSLGSRGRAVHALEKRLNALHYRLRFGTASTARTPTKRCSRSRRCTASPAPAASRRDLWHKLGRGQRPTSAPRAATTSRSTKTRQVLFEVRHGWSCASSTSRPEPRATRRSGATTST